MAVINGVGIASAIRQGLVVEPVEHDEGSEPQTMMEDDQSMFIPEVTMDVTDAKSSDIGLNPAAATFTPSASPFEPPTVSSIPPIGSKPLFGTTFGANVGGPLQKSQFGIDAAASPPNPIVTPSQTSSSDVKGGNQQPFAHSTFGSGMFNTGNQDSSRSHTSAGTGALSGSSGVGNGLSRPTSNPSTGSTTPAFNVGFGQSQPITTPTSFHQVSSDKLPSSNEAILGKKQPELFKSSPGPLFGTPPTNRWTQPDNRDATHEQNGELIAFIGPLLANWRLSIACNS